MDARAKEHYDNAFLGILQNEGNIHGFLEAVFGFLYRRTDFYRILTSKDGKMGFPPGVAERMTHGAFKAFEAKAKEDEKHAQEALQKKSSKTTKKKDEDQSKSNKTPSTREETTPVQSPAEATATTTTTTSTSDKRENLEQKHSGGDGPATQQGNAESKEKDEDELSRQQKIFQENPESYNGAMRDKYSWSQSITDVDILIKVPSYIKKGKDVKVDIKRKKLKVSYKDDKGEWIDWLDDNLTWEINSEESMWSLVPGEGIQVNLEKVQERWWEAVLENEPKISVQKIHPERPMTDLDEESQVKIQQMMYDDRMKKMGKPTSKDQKMHEMLKQAWDAEGSPFKGQPFDPSKMNLESNNVMNIN